ncbi:MAG: 3'-5' exonuclease domain-containing protein 2 [Clostridium sp.]|nr:3'-5' exonuclease domain-containing protein 2 [Clostridium sp.]
MPDNYSVSIPKTEISSLPVETFRGDVKLIDKPEDVAPAVESLRQCKVIGFDTETRPSFKKNHANKVALMQLSTDSVCYLFRLNKIGFPQALQYLIESPDILKIGLSVHDDFSVMHRSSQFEPAGFIDLQHIVKQYHIADLSLQRIYAILFGKKISKQQRLTNWEAPSLTMPQQVYAATDAWACLRIYDCLTSGQFDPKKSPYQTSDNQNTAS